MPYALPSPFAIFRRRDFRLLFGAQFISSAGSGLTTVGASILVYQLTGSALSVGLMLMATAVPSLIVGLLAGVYVDRTDRKRVMVVAQLLRGATVGLIPWLLTFGVTWIYVLIMVSSAVESFFAPAQASVLPETAPDEELTAANALMMISDCAALTLGFAGAGALAGMGRLNWAFWLDACSYVLAAGCIGLMQIRASLATSETTAAVVLHNLREGLVYVGTTTALRSLLLIGIPIALIYGLLNALLLPFASRGLGGSELDYAIIEALSTIGFVVGGFVMVWFGERLHAGQWVAASYMTMGLTGVAFALAPTVQIAFALTLLMGFFNTPSYVGRSLIIQRNTPAGTRGRVTSVFAVSRDSIFLVGMASAGLADLMDVRLLMLCATIGLTVTGTLALRLPGLGQPSAEWRRVWQMLRTAPQSATLGLGRAALPGDIERLVTLLPALATLSPQQRQTLLSAARLHTVAAGTPVIRQGEPGDAAYFLLDGRTVATVGTERGEILETHAAGSLFGEIAALTGVPRTATVLAEQPTTLIQVPAAALRVLMQAPQIRQLLLGTLADRVLRLQVNGLTRFSSLDQLELRELRLGSPAQPPLAETGASAS